MTSKLAVNSLSLLTKDRGTVPEKGVSEKSKLKIEMSFNPRIDVIVENIQPKIERGGGVSAIFS